jgi:uncharacterized membrane protein
MPAHAPAEALAEAPATARFPLAAGLLFGIGLGGFFDGIVLHQLLQWHHMLSSHGHPPTSLEHLSVNTFWDGVFHAATYACVLAALLLLWRQGRTRPIRWSWRQLFGSLLLGFGGFNIVEGSINHHLLGLHHVNETVAREHWPLWDWGFLLISAVMLGVGLWLYRQGRHDDAVAR